MKKKITRVRFFAGEQPEWFMLAAHLNYAPFDDEKSFRQ